jgi:putative membrane protein
MGIRTTLLVVGLASAMSVAAWADDSAKIDGNTFAKKAAVIGKAEVELGQIALANSSDKDVRSFATRMVEDHTAAAEELKAAAAADNVALPKKPTPNMQHSRRSSRD